MSWTQGELAKATGVKLGHISKLECDTLDPKISTVYKLINGLDCSADTLLLNNENTALSSILKAQYERVAKLPDENQRVLIDVLDKYCNAMGLQGFLNDGNKGSLHWMKGKTPDALPANNEE